MVAGFCFLNRLVLTQDGRFEFIDLPEPREAGWQGAGLSIR